MSSTVVSHPTRGRHRPDAELVLAVRAGSDDAFAAVVDRYGVVLHAYARSVLGGAHHDAEEAVQDAFVRALAALRRQPRQEIVLRPWLYTIVRNACLDRLRRPVRTVALEAMAGVLGDTGSDPADVFAHAEELRDLVGDLRRLPDRQRRALVGFELEGRTHEQLAGELEVSVSASKALVCRARAGLAAARLAA